ncbi:25236_t:CDS:1, partial [Racocetra persica]
NRPTTAAMNYENDHELRNTQAFCGLENGDQNRVRVEKDMHPAPDSDQAS